MPFKDDKQRKAVMAMLAMRTKEDRKGGRDILKKMGKKRASKRASNWATKRRAAGHMESGAFTEQLYQYSKDELIDLILDSMSSKERRIAGEDHESIMDRRSKPPVRAYAEHLARQRKKGR